MKKRQNTLQDATALRSTISVMLMLVSAVLVSLAASPEVNRTALPRSDAKIALRPLPTQPDTPSWMLTGSMMTYRSNHTTTLLPNGKVLVVGGEVIGIFLSSAELYDPATGTWSATGSMAAARSRHTATLLRSGKVLVVGGYNVSGGTILNSAELYDPASGTWSTTGSMAHARGLHTATLLPNGKVLVAGGLGGDSCCTSLNSAELYDPASGTWTMTGSLATSHYFHTATLLPNGKVLVTGGEGSSVQTPTSAELYDPALGTWSITGSMANPHERHTATLLPTGKVLVAGGYIYPVDSVNSAELYDPASGTWSTTGSLATGRFDHTATLLPTGKVLVAGGQNVFPVNLSSAELYDPGSGTWSATSSLTTPRRQHTATLLANGKVLVSGGRDQSDLQSLTAELYDSAVGSWSNTGSLGTPGVGTATLLPSGKVLVIGNSNSDTLGSAELYDAATGNWSSTGSLHTGRFSHTATLLSNGTVLVAGGEQSLPPHAFIYLRSAELYDPASGTWSSTSSLSIPRYDHTATLLPNNKVLVAGGGTTNGAIVGSAELYDTVSGTWSATGSLSATRYDHTATLLPNGKVLVAGGFGNNGFLTSTELYDPASGTWSSTGNLSMARVDHTATLLPNGKVLITGGISTGYLSSAELYDPTTGTWSPTGNMATARSNHTATLLPNGKVLVAGGFQQLIDGIPHYLSSAELYDPASGMWSSTSSLSVGRESPRATLLPNGKVLVAGGFANSITLSSAELYDVGLGFDPSWQPLLTNVSPFTVPNGSALVATGSRFKGISEASGGNGSQNSSSNYPLVQLLSLTNEQTLFLPVDSIAGWSDTSFTSQPLTVMTDSSSGFPVGYALVTVFTNGIPSRSQFVLAAPAPAGDCTVCHKHTLTLDLPCNSMDYRRHLDHGDTIGACPSGPGRKD